MNLVPTGSQTIGPFFHVLYGEKNCNGQIAGPNAKGERVKLVCTVFDGEGKLVTDALLEVWQANAEGKYNHPEDAQDKQVESAFIGFGRLASDEEGVCTFETVKPGSVPSWTNALQAPHLNISIFARGLLKQLTTRIYFEGDPGNSEDPVLRLVPDDRRETLMAQRDPHQQGVWRINIHLCGKRETVFFDV